MVAYHQIIMQYNFYGHDTPVASPINDEYKKIKSQYDLYDRLSGIWCEYTCAPRLRKDWSKHNKTLGQCSITAFLVQDIFGGKVFGVPTDNGGKHCFNVVNGFTFDLTSEQFQGKPIDYADAVEQSRDEHFAKREKYERYLYLVKELKKTLE